MQPRVVIAENDLDLQRLFSKAFTHANFEVFTAIDQHSIFQAVDTYAPHIMVLDLGLEGDSGLDVLEMLEAHPHRAQMTVIVVTGNHRASDSLEAELADLFLLKPVSTRELITLANRFMKY